MNEEIATANEKEFEKCFIITPIGSESSSIRREIEGVIFSAIEPVLNDFNLVSVVAHKISSPGSINNQIIQHIVQDKLVIANLTELNPNVMYELAIRHATKKPVIHICKEGTILPFDIKAERTLFYKNDMQGTLELRESLKLIITEALRKEEWDDNPIYNAVKFDFLSKLKSENIDSNLSEFLINAFQSMQEDLKEIKRATPGFTSQPYFYNILDYKKNNKYDIEKFKNFINDANSKLIVFGSIEKELDDGIQDNGDKNDSTE